MMMHLLISDPKETQRKKLAEVSDSVNAERRAEIAAWKAILAEHQKPSFWRASWQIVNTIGTYAVLWYLMYLSLSVSWWITPPLAVLAGGGLAF